VGLSCRLYLLDRNDTLYRLPNTAFDQMLRDPKGHPLPRFAGVRVRTADIIVELVDRRPTRIVRATFGILPFDGDGILDSNEFMRRQFARAEPILSSMIAEPDYDTSVVDAESRFVAQGGRWAPSSTLLRLLGEAALDRVKCMRL
jgi:hypothetical protein